MVSKRCHQKKSNLLSEATCHSILQLWQGILVIPGPVQQSVVPTQERKPKGHESLHDPLVWPYVSDFCQHISQEPCFFKVPILNEYSLWFGCEVWASKITPASSSPSSQPLSIPLGPHETTRPLGQLANVADRLALTRGHLRGLDKLRWVPGTAGGPAAWGVDAIDPKETPQK